MPFIVTKKNDYVPAPEGSYRSVICDVEDLGDIGTTFGTRHMCRISFQLDEEIRPGQRFVVGRRYNVSLHSSSALHGLLATLLGEDFNGESADLERLIGLPCLVAIQQSQAADGNVYGNVGSVARLPRGVEPIVVESYKRHQDRDPRLVSQPRHQTAATEEKPKPAATAAKKAKPAAAEADGITDNDVPF